jgi:uncharacterized membrane protein YidH (DUF202 family)
MISAPGGGHPTGLSHSTVEDAGLRTNLAWVRSALAFGAVGAAMLKDFEPLGRARPVEGLIALLLGGAVVLLAVGYVIRRRRYGAATPRSLLLVAAGTLTVGVIAFVLGSTG